jgi:hypothetical protein
VEVSALAAEFGLEFIRYASSRFFGCANQAKLLTGYAKCEALSTFFILLAMFASWHENIKEFLKSSEYFMEWKMR